MLSGNSPTSSSTRPLGALGRAALPDDDPGDIGEDAATHPDSMKHAGTRTPGPPVSANVIVKLPPVTRLSSNLPGQYN